MPLEKPVEKSAIELLQERIAGENWAGLGRHYQDLHLQDIAKAFKGLEAKPVKRALDELPRERWPEIFPHIEPVDKQYDLLQLMAEEDGRFVLEHLSADDRTHLLESLPKRSVEQLLRLLSPATVKQALTLLDYPEDSAGRLMATEYVSLRPDWTLEQALTHVRKEGSTGLTVNTLYITDHQEQLIGTISLKRLVLGAPDAVVADLISGPPVSIQAAEDQAEAARIIQHYDITALPVVDPAGAMLGVVTVDDVIDVLEEENTEDFHKIGGMGSLEMSLRDARPSRLYRKRVGWLVLLVFMNIFGGAAIAYFETTIEAVIALVFFLPLIVDSGGNAGSQAATLMVRALATGDVGPKDWLRLWGKELGVATALGLTMGLAVWGLGVWRGGSEVGIVVASAMVCVVIFGSMVGMLLPFILTRMKLDPATASAPLITSVADISGIVIYFSIATAVISLPT